MSWLTPLAFLGLLTLPAILLLHLLRNRREQLPISSLRLWLGLQQKKHGDLPRHIPLSVMLLLQLLMATALTLGLARPALSFLLDRPQHTIYILDTTTSMAAEDASLPRSLAGGAPRFDVARQIVQEQLRAMGDNDTFTVISLNRRPEVLLAGDAEQKTQAALTLDNVVPGATGVDLPVALTLANGLVEPGRRNQIIVLTDGNYTVEAGTLPPMQVPVTWQIIPSESPRAGAASNQALLNVSSRTLPDGRHRLFARVVNYSDTPATRTLRVLVGEHSAPPGTAFDEVSVQLEGQAETARVWTLPESAQTVLVQIVEPDVLPLDNQAELWLRGTTRHRILLVSDVREPQSNDRSEPEAEALVRALEVQPGVELTTVETSAMSRYDSTDFDLIVFDGLPFTLTTWPRGNLLVVNPPLGHPLLPAQNFVRNLRPDLETASTLLTGVDLSGVYFSRAPQLTLPEWAEADLMAVAPAGGGLGAAALRLGSGQAPAGQTGQGYPLIFHGFVDNSRLMVWAFDLAEGNLPARLALPLLTANTLSSLLSASPPPVVALGEPVLIGPNLSVEIPEGRRLVPSSQSENGEGSVFSRTKQPGLYRIYNENDNPIGGFAIHAGSALESNLTVHFEPDTLIGDKPTGLVAGPTEIEYYEFWPWLAGLALAVVAVEGWLAWRR